MAPGYSTDGRFAAVAFGNREIAMGVAPAKQGEAAPQDARAGGDIAYYADGLLLDLELDCVRVLPAGPLEARARPASVWVDGMLLVVFGYRHPSAGRERFTDAALFDPTE